jgi:hypothetical protein
MIGNQEQLTAAKWQLIFLLQLLLNRANRAIAGAHM